MVSDTNNARPMPLLFTRSFLLSLANYESSEFCQFYSQHVSRQTRSNVSECRCQSIPWIRWQFLSQQNWSWCELTSVDSTCQDSLALSKTFRSRSPGFWMIEVDSVMVNVVQIQVILWSANPKISRSFSIPKLQRFKQSCFENITINVFIQKLFSF